MKKITILILVLNSFFAFSQEEKTEYTKRVLENTELDIISSFYSQKGENAAVTGGVGNEKLSDIATNIVLSIPMNDDNVFTIDATISAYTSASSSNLNPFDASGASSGGDDDDEFDDKPSSKKALSSIIGSPWIESSGASKSDIWANANFNYSHSSKDRNSIVSANASVSTEYDYFSIGFGGGYTKLFNKKNTEIGIKGSIYLDTWHPKYPTELDSYLEVGGNLNDGFFENVDILNQNGNIINKNNSTAWSPFQNKLIEDKGRNTYSFSFSLSQIISKKAQISLFFDVVQQNGWLANPMQRVYFSDRQNFYIGNGSSIPNYTSKSNKDVFQLADDIERLPDSRLKIPIGARFNYYLNEVVSIRTYYRYYYDDWGITSHTTNIEVPVKISNTFTVYPSYRYYNQTAADYFAPYEQLVSTSNFYTSDYDLSEFNSNQFGFGISYTDIFTKRRIWKFGLKSVDLNYSNYKRNTGLNAGIVTAGFKFLMD
jgi:hypothetical protein